jgi:hypothetical protein
MHNTFFSHSFNREVFERRRCRCTLWLTAHTCILRTTIFYKSSQRNVFLRYPQVSTVVGKNKTTKTQRKKLLCPPPWLCVIFFCTQRAQGPQRKFSGTLRLLRWFQKNKMIKKFSAFPSPKNITRTISHKP